MADNIQLNTMSGGSTAATDERSINGNTVHIQRQIDIGSSTFANGQASVTNSAANIVAARDTRKYVTIINAGAIDIYIGLATVTTANGVKIPPGAAIDLETTAAVQGITAAGTGAAHYIEFYDS